MLTSTHESIMANARNMKVIAFLFAILPRVTNATRFPNKTEQCQCSGNDYVHSEYIALTQPVVNVNPNPCYITSIGCHYANSNATANANWTEGILLYNIVVSPNLPQTFIELAKGYYINDLEQCIKKKNCWPHLTNPVLNICVFICT